jgi:hypothetical protein
MENLFEGTTTTRKRRDENENRSETLVINEVVVLLNDHMLYIRQDMNADVSLGQLLETMSQIRRSIQIGSKQRQRMVIFPNVANVMMFYAPHFERGAVRQLLVERLHAQL